MSQVAGRGRLGIWAIGVWALVMTAVFFQPAVSIVVASLGFALTWWGVSCLTDDRVCVRIACWSYGLKIVLTSVLYYTSFYRWPILGAYQGERGFWVFAEDALAYHFHASNLVHAWSGTAPWPQTDVSNWSFIVYVGVLYRAFGLQPLVVSFLNAWWGSVIVGAGLVMLQRWASSPAAIRLGVGLLAFWPSLLLWSSQPMKDPFLLALIMLVLATLVVIVDARPRSRPAFLRLTMLLGGLLLVLSLFRYYAGTQVGIVVAVIAMGMAIREFRRAASRSAVRMLVVSMMAPCVLAVAGQIDIRELATPPPAQPVLAEPVSLPAPVSEGQPVIVEESSAAPLPEPVLEPSISPLAPTLPSPSAAGPATGGTSSPAGRVPARSARPLADAPPPLPEASSSSAPSPSNADQPSRARLGHSVGSVGWFFRTFVGQIQGIVADGSIRSLDNRRSGFLSTGGYSLMDPEKRFGSVSEALGYLPRGLSLAILAPFPKQWFDVGGSTKAFRVFTAVEAMLVWLLVGGFLLRISEVRRLGIQSAAVLFFVMLSAIPMCLIVANLGTLFRLRLQFLLPLVTLLCGVDIWGGYRQLLWRRRERSLRA